MNKKKWMKILFLSFLVVCVGQAKSQNASDTKSKMDEHKIVVEIPVVLEKANVVFNMDHLAFVGDLPVGINYMHLLANRYKEMKTIGQIIGVFQGDAAYMTLNDEAYNAYRKVTTRAILTKDSLLN